MISLISFISTRVSLTGTALYLVLTRSKQTPNEGKSVLRIPLEAYTGKELY